MTIDQQRSDINEELTELRLRRGVMTLDGDDTAELTKRIFLLETQLTALTEAEGEAAKRQRAAEQLAYQKHLAALRTKLSNLEHERLSWIDELEAAVRRAELTFNKILDIATEQSKTTHALTQASVPTVMSRNETERRLAMRMCALLGKIKGVSAGARVGHLELHNTGLFKAGDVWRPGEARLMAGPLTALMVDIPLTAEKPNFPQIAKGKSNAPQVSSGN